MLSGSASRLCFQVLAKVETGKDGLEIICIVCIASGLVHRDRERQMRMDRRGNARKSCLGQVRAEVRNCHRRSRCESRVNLERFAGVLVSVVDWRAA